MTASSTIQVLLIEDNPGDARLVREHITEIKREGLLNRMRGPEQATDVSITHESNLAEGIDHLRANEVDIVLLDLQLPDSSGLSGIGDVTEAAPEVPVVVLTGMPEQRLGIDAVSRGAQDYLVKDDLEPHILLKTIQYAIERKGHEQELRRRSEQLSILTRLMRHDIRNDVSLVVGRAQELTELVDPRGQDRLEEIIQSGNHVLQLTRTIGDALDSITSREGEALSAVDLESVLSEEVDRAATLYRGAEVTLGEVPPVDVQANRLLSSVVANLINNGIFYNDKDVPRVHVHGDANGDTAQIRVTDNGPGIPASQQDILFEEEIQSEKSNGLGIGLMLAHRIVQQYDGSIWIEDNEPTGTIFVVELQRP